jgi:putative cardiolipin synthase
LIVAPANSYGLALQADDGGGSPHLRWRIQENSRAAEYEKEPARSAWQRTKVNLLSLFQLDSEL